MATCSGVTAAGKPCRFNVSADGGYCRHHKDQDNGGNALDTETLKGLLDDVLGSDDEPGKPEPLSDTETAILDELKRHKVADDVLDLASGGETDDKRARRAYKGLVAKGLDDTLATIARKVSGAHTAPKKPVDDRPEIGATAIGEYRPTKGPRKGEKVTTISVVIGYSRKTGEPITLRKGVNSWRRWHAAFAVGDTDTIEKAIADSGGAFEPYADTPPGGVKK